MASLARSAAGRHATAGEVCRGDPWTMGLRSGAGRGNPTDSGESRRMSDVAPDLSIVIVSHGDRQWLSPCLRSLARHADGLRLEAIIVENGPQPAEAISAPEA